jgi:hypothetical protein
LEENRDKYGKKIRINSIFVGSFLLLASLFGLILISEEVSAAGEGVTIESPTEGMMIYGSTMDLNLTFTNFVLNPSFGSPNVANEGHWHLYINDVMSGMYAVEDLELTDLPAGNHEIEVELVNNDHSSLDPKVSDIVNITVVHPMIEITHPMDGHIQYKNDLDVHVMIENFTMNASAIGMDNMAGEGHYHIYINGGLVGPYTDMMTMLNDLPAGTHELKVELVNNDHSSLDPMVMDMVSFTIVDKIPSIMLKMPMDGHIQYTDDLMVEVMIENFTMNASAIGMDNMPGEGHYHIYINDGLVGPYTDLMVLIEDLPDGMHMMKVELVNNDHSPLVPPVYDMADFTIWNTNTMIDITHPMDNSILYKNDLELYVMIENFTMNASAIGMDNMAGEGHYHIYINDILVGPYTDMMVMLNDLPAGDHVLKVQLVNNDHTPIYPIAMDMIHFTIVEEIPMIKLLKPMNGTISYGGMLHVEVMIENFTMNESAIGMDNMPGEGHWHLYINENLVGPYTTMKVVLSDLPAGDHILKVELRNNDHSMLHGPMDHFMDMAHFTIVETLPMVHIMHPMNGSLIYSDQIDIHVDIENFTLNGSAIGMMNMEGEGHYHVYINDALIGPYNETMLTLTDLPAGDHVLKVVLVNNDHSYISPMVMDMVHFTLSDDRPMIEIMKPDDEAYFYGGELMVEVSVDGFLMNGSAIGGNNTAGEGHWHLYINGDLIGPYTGSMVTLTDLPAGYHELKVMLVNNDHSPVMPYAMDMVMFHLLSIPTIEITSPDNGTNIEGTSLSLEVEVMNFMLNSSAIGGENMAGEGHYHIYVNDDLIGPYTDLMVTLSDLPAGDHVLKVELRNNDHSEIGVVAMDMLYFTISPPPMEIEVSFGPVLMDGDPVEGAMVEIMSGDMEYSGTTDENGIVNFTVPAEWIGESINYTVTKDGYDDIEGTGTVGDNSISVSGDIELEKEDDDDPTMIWIIILVLVVLVAIALFVMMRSKGKDDLDEEE